MDTSSPLPPEAPAIPAAMQAYRLGFTPLPVRPGQKRPSNAAWSEFRYQDEQHCWETFVEEQGKLRDGELINIGLSLGEASGGLIDIDLDHPKAMRLSRLILPRTMMKSGRESRPASHFWYIASDDIPSSRRFTLPSGEVLVEIRSTGSQTVIPPSIHPSGEHYEWHGQPFGGDQGPEHEHGVVIAARATNLALMATLLDAWPKRGSRHEAYLALTGGLLRYGGFDGETGAIHELWEQQLPDAIRLLAEATDDEDGPEARVHEVFDSTLRKLRTGAKVQGWPTLAKIIGQAHTDKVIELAREIEGLLGYAARGGPSRVDFQITDESIAESGQRVRERHEQLRDAPVEERDPLAERADTWESVDLRPYLAMEHVGPQPGVLHRTDGVGLFYVGRVNSLYGSSESGKTWLAMQAIKETINLGGRAMLIDCEDGPGIAIARLRDIGVGDDPIVEQFSYINPETPLGSLMVDRYGHPQPNDTGKANETALTAALDLMQPQLIVVDGLTALYGLHSLNPNDAAATDKITSWLRRLTNNNARTVIMIDHTSKGSVPGSTPTGSQHKVAMVQGAALQVVSTQKPKRGKDGSIQVYIGKDRPGEVSRHVLDEHESDRLIADIEFHSDEDGRVKLDVNPPKAGHVYISGEQQRHRKPKVDPEQRLRADQELILAALSRCSGPARRNEIALAMQPESIPEQRFRDAIKGLLSSGRITATGNRPQTKYALPVMDSDL